MIAERIAEKLNCDIIELKPIIPFATNAGWLGRPLKGIKNLCKNLNVEKEMNIVFTEDYIENKLVRNIEEIDKWIESL